MSKNSLEDNLDKQSITKLPKGGFSVEVSDDFYKNMLSSDKPECEFKRGDRVEKAIYKPGDIHKIGDKGIIMGTLFERNLGEAYLVKFDDLDDLIFTVKEKLKIAQ